MTEISPENRSELEKRYRTTVFVIVFQIFTVIALIIAAWFVAQTSENSITNQSLTTLWVAVLFIAVGAFVIRRLIFSWERLKNTALLKGITGLIQTLQINSIILGVIAEIVAIHGIFDRRSERQQMGNVSRRSNFAGRLYGKFSEKIRVEKNCR